MPRTRASSEARSTRSTRSSKSRQSGEATERSEVTSTRASSASSSSSYTPAQYVNMLHMDHMTRYMQSTEAQEGLDTLLEIVKHRDGGPEAPDYQSALSELDYLEGLFKKLRFSYKEQLTKETVVRRILELELPVLSATDIDAMVQDTEAERQRLREIKNVAREQGAAAEAIIRDLAGERQYVAGAESEMATLPDRLLHLRHRLVRMKLALRAELQSLDEAEGGMEEGVVPSSGPVSTAFQCSRCGREFHTEAFLALHQALHNAPTLAVGEEGGAAAAAEALIGWDAEGADVVPAFPMRPCPGCSEQVAALFLDSAPQDETHAALHARVRREVARAAEALERLAVGADAQDDALELRSETEEIVVRLQLDEAEMVELEAQAREEAARQAAIEGETAQSLDHLRESVGSIRLEMMRIEQEADRMVQHMEGKTSVGRTLQEQAELFGLLMGE
ncbi:zinc finger transcription factor [Grosmannia clavigera kw1407]|uniref:Zinc finger transcription factor n=1 Tax=Grosmannia clavigera (strain kw1407 / UAMH 11150) TaxID=655863 RepID=F0XB83_GROCL|nr:zinc finger transcription factor [Grosmannia clavigera kw1407]EFX05048.1 zinc finger transcription factor [Grosmannia clavigera kw1407]